jgi:predicted nicotinamide N-methyase
MDDGHDARCRRFVSDHTALRAPPLTPEIMLHLAGEVMVLWRETEAHDAAKTISPGGLPPPYWAFAWPGGQALARYVLDTASDVRGKRVLDFGAGSGLVAIAAAKAGAAQVTAVDIDALARAAIALNAAANGVIVDIQAHDVIGTPPCWDTVLAGDMCYERPLAENLFRWLRELAASGTRVLIGDPGRNYFPTDGVEKRATYIVPTSRDLEDRESRETSVYAVLP